METRINDRDIKHLHSFPGDRKSVLMRRVMSQKPDTTVKLRMMMLAGACPVATITAAVAASIPPSRKNCQGWRNGSPFALRASEDKSCALLVKVS